MLQIITWELAAITAILGLLPAMLRADKSKPAGFGAFALGFLSICGAGAVVLMSAAQVSQ
jgi:hypothetical protein